MKKVIKIIMAVSLSIFAVGTTYAQEFMGVKLENTTPEILNKTIEKAGGQLVKNKSNKLVKIYVFKKSSIPSAVNAATYWNESGEWVGLRVGFEYHEHNNRGLRKNLVEKYGNPIKIKEFLGETKNTNKFTDEHFFDLAFWEFEKVSLEYNSNSFKDKLETSSDPFDTNSESVHVSFKHKERYKSLKDNVEDKVNKVNKEKWKGVF